MRRLSAGVLLVLGLVAVALSPAETPAQGFPCPGVTFRLAGYAYEQLTVSNTAKTLTSATYTAGGVVPFAAFLSVETDAIRWRDDGTAPTATVGTPLAVNNSGWVCGASIGRLQMIRQTTDATVNVNYYKPS